MKKPIISTLLLAASMFAQNVWTPPATLAAGSIFSAIAASGNTIHFAYLTQKKGKVDYRHSLDGGVTWGPEQQLTNTPADSQVPRIAVTSDFHIHVVWNEGGSTFEYIRSAL